MGDFDKISTWASKAGLESEHIDLSIKYICDITSNGLLSLSVEQLDDIILKINAYNLYLNSTKGRLLAKIGYVEGKLKQELNIESSKLLSKYRNKEEREAVALKLRPELNQMNEKLISLRAMYAYIKDVPYSIDSIIRSINIIYNRKSRENVK